MLVCIHILHGTVEGFFMTILTSIANAGLAINFAISGSITDALKIECVEDPQDENNVICDFDNLWILVIIVNLTSLIPLVLIKTVPDEKELEVINKKLQQSSNEVSVSNDESDDDNHRDYTPDKDEMIGVYWFCLDKIFPICKCTCCDNDNDDNTTKKIELGVPNNNHHSIDLEETIGC